MRILSLEPDPELGARGGRRRAPALPRSACGVAGCAARTTNRKPFCIEHLQGMPYVAHLRANERVRDQEAARARKTWKAVDPSGSRADEILSMLATRGASTPKRLAIYVDLDTTALEGYLTALARAGRITIHELGSRRGQPRIVAELTPAERARRDVDELEEADAA